MSAPVVWPDDLFLDLNRAGPVPLYHQVSSRLEAAIRDGDIPAGARLETELGIASRLGLSRLTVRRALQTLVDKGLLVRRRGIGTQVVHGPVTRQVELTSLYEDLMRSHRQPGTVVLTHELCPARGRVAESLGIEIGSHVLHLRRLRSSDGVPIALMENYLARKFVSISPAQLGEHGLYELLRARGVSIRVAKQRIGARREQGESKLLEIDKGSPVLTIERTAYDSSGQAVEYAQHCYRPDLYSVETTLIAK